MGTRTKDERHDAIDGDHHFLAGETNRDHVEVRMLRLIHFQGVEYRRHYWWANFQTCGGVQHQLISHRLESFGRGAGAAPNPEN